MRHHHHREQHSDAVHQRVGQQPNHQKVPYPRINRSKMGEQLGRVQPVMPVRATKPGLAADGRLRCRFVMRGPFLAPGRRHGTQRRSQTQRYARTNETGRQMPARQ